MFRPRFSGEVRSFIGASIVIFVLRSYLASGKGWKTQRKAGVYKPTFFKRTLAIAQGREYVSIYHIPYPC